MKNFFRSETDDWKIKNTKKNEIVERIIYEKFQSILKKHRKKQVIVNTLSLLISNIFRNGENSLFLDNEEKRYVFEYWNSYEKMKMTGMLLNFSKSHTKNDFYMYGDKKIFHRTLAKILDEMEKENWCIRRDGYFCFNNGYNKQFEIGYYLFNWPKFYEIYIQYDDLDIQIEDNYSPVVIKRKKDGNYKNCTNEYNTELLFKDDIQYVNNLRNMYSKMSVTLDMYNANDVQKQIFEDYLLSKRYEYEQKDSSNVFQYDINEDINFWNRRLSKKFKPYRLFHCDNEIMNWGRVYGNGIDSLPKMYKDSILKINDEYTVSIDVKSSILQFYILTYHEEIDNKQDFYLYSSLQNIDREHLKILSQCLLYNSNLLNAMRAYNHHCIKQSDYNNILNLNDFTSIYQKMIRERNYLNNLFLHPEMSKQMILHESSYMKLVSNELMKKQNIPHLLNFDAIYTSYKNLSIVVDIFYSLSIDKFNKPIFIDNDKDLYNSLINNNRCLI